jgi:hypothetical protein
MRKAPRSFRIFPILCLLVGCSSSGSGAADGSTAGGGSASSAGGQTIDGVGGSGSPSVSGGATSSSAGAPGAGGSNTGAGGSTSSGGSAELGTGGTASSAGASSGGTSACGSTTHNLHPLGCKFGWGIASPGGSLSNYSYLQLMSNWVGSEVKADGSINSCSACSWLSGQVAKTNIVPAYYAYFIGFYGHVNGLADGNLANGGASLTTGGAALIKANRSKIIQMYTWYAQQTYEAWPTKPLIWLLEGDFVQYAATSQSSPLTYTELGQLAADITCAIKANMPNAVVAIDHSTWNSDDVTNQFWKAMAVANYDLVWTTGVASNNGFLESSGSPTYYNHATATYTYLHSLTGRTILSDTSAGASAASDSWSTASVADLDARISEGVIGANITGTMPANLQSNISARASLEAIPACP